MEKQNILQSRFDGSENAVLNQGIYVKTKKDASHNFKKVECAVKLNFGWKLDNSAGTDIVVFVVVHG